jgi:hypothetical protein
MMRGDALASTELRFTLRQLRRNPGFTVAVVLTFALGVGAATTVFTVEQAPATLTEAGPAVRLNGIRITPALLRALAGAPKALAGPLFEVQPVHPATLVGAVSVLFAVGLIAAFVPALLPCCL